MLCHIVTGLRHLLLAVASMRVSQASVAKMLQGALVKAPMNLEQQLSRERLQLKEKQTGGDVYLFQEM
jgi:hypothetical protein